MSGLVCLAPGPAPTRWAVSVPGSKSLTNRALLVAAVASGRSWLGNVQASADATAMERALTGLGVVVTAEGGDRVVGGLAGPPTASASLNCEMAGTVGRFLLPVVAAGRGRFDLDAHPQLRRRPLGPILDALRAQGAEIHGESFPLTVEASGLRGGVIDIDTGVSSQFLSGLMLAAPLAAAPTTLRFTLALSRPYVELTAAVMRDFGARVSLDLEAGVVSVEPGGYRSAVVGIEPDASTASYFLAAAALSASTVELPGLSRALSGQGDLEIVDHLVGMGATLEDAPAGLALTGPGQGLAGVAVDMAQASDVFMTLACVAPFADSPTLIEGLANVRVKESDRLAATAENLRRLGVEVEEGPDYLRVLPLGERPLRADVTLPTYEDHRIAMAFSLIGLRVPVRLEDPRVVDKTCPQFWELWRATGAQVTSGEDVTIGPGRAEAGRVAADRSEADRVGASRAEAGRVGASRLCQPEPHTNDSPPLGRAT